METLQKCVISLIVLLFFAPPVLAKDFCVICGNEITDTVYLVTDEVTGVKQMVCADCVKLPRCFICSMPVKDDGLELPDGRCLCARDKRTAVLTAAEARRVANEVQDQLERLFARFTTFPTNVDVTVLDRIDVDRMFQPGGNDFESPNLLGCIQAETDGGIKRYSMRLMTGLPLAELQATAAHEFSHAWVAENVSPERRHLLSRNAEEGFCELVAYLLMDSQNEEAQKKFILKNFYTRGQVELFIEGSKMYGFDEILDWMQYGDTTELEPDRLDKIRDVVMPRLTSISGSSSSASSNRVAQPISKPAEPTASLLTATQSNRIGAPVGAPLSKTIRIQGIFWGKSPSAIINGHEVFPDDQFKMTINDKVLSFHCLEIRKNSVLVENIETGIKEDLQF